MKTRNHLPARRYRWSMFSTLFAAAFVAGIPAAAQAESITYQGRLTDNGALASGEYDLEINLFANPSGGTPLGTTVHVDDLLVTGGLFTLDLDFGDGLFKEPRYIEIGVRPGSSGGAYTTLLDRRSLGTAPSSYFADTIYKKIRIVRDSGNSLQNGDDLRQAVVEVQAAGASAGNPYLIMVEPGGFDLGSTGLTLPGGVHVEGAGADLTWLMVEDDHIVSINGTTSMRNIGLYVSGVSGPAGGLRINSSDPVRMHYVLIDIESDSCSGVTFLGPNDADLEILHSTISVRSPFASGVGNVISLEMLSPASEIVLDQCKLEATNFENAFVLHNQFGSPSVTISDSTVYVSGANTPTSTGTVIEDTGNARTRINDLEARLQALGILTFARTVGGVLKVEGLDCDASNNTGGPPFGDFTGVRTMGLGQVKLARASFTSDSFLEDFTVLDLESAQSLDVKDLTVSAITGATLAGSSFTLAHLWPTLSTNTNIDGLDVTATGFEEVTGILHESSSPLIMRDGRFLLSGLMATLIVNADGGDEDCDGIEVMAVTPTTAALLQTHSTGSAVMRHVRYTHVASPPLGAPVLTSMIRHESSGNLELHDVELSLQSLTAVPAFHEVQFLVAGGLAGSVVMDDFVVKSNRMQLTPGSFITGIENSGAQPMSLRDGVIELSADNGSVHGVTNNSFTQMIDAETVKMTLETSGPGLKAIGLLNNGPGLHARDCNIMATGTGGAEGMGAYNNSPIGPMVVTGGRLGGNTLSSLAPGAPIRLAVTELVGNGALNTLCNNCFDNNTVPMSPTCQQVDGDSDGYNVYDGDCDDADNSVHPGAADPLDGVDQDCDGFDG